jgi:uncharacterized protein (DUF427 family)
MSLSLGTGPFGHRPAGVWSGGFDVPGHVIWFEQSPRRVRGRLGGETVVDSGAVKLLHESRHLPVWYFPVEDVRTELLEGTDRHTRCPVKGQASYWTVRAGGRIAENAAWSYPDPIEGSEFLAGHVAFDFSALDEWFEEDEQVFVHPRDPYHRIDVMETSRRIHVAVDGETVAETSHALALFESNLPPRWYLPAEDVRLDLLSHEPQLETACPYKGTASYWAAGDPPRPVAWTYDEPIAEVARIARRVCFFGERDGIDVTVDGELERPGLTPWSSDDWMTARS